MRLKTLHVYSYLAFSSASSLIALAIAISVARTNMFVAYPLFILTAMALASSALGIPRLKTLSSKGDEYKFSIAVVQHAWWPASCGFAGLVMFHAEYFARALGAIYSTVLLAFSAVWFAWGIYIMVYVHRKTGAPLMP